MAKQSKFVVHGALVTCSKSVGKIKISMHATSKSEIGNQLLITANDITPKSFKGNFGSCKRYNGMPCVMGNLKGWFDPNEKFRTEEGVPVIKTDSVLICMRGGGAITPVTDGQIQEEEMSKYYVPPVWFPPKPQLGERDINLPKKWVAHTEFMCNELNVDFYLALAFMLHESGGKADAINKKYTNPLEQATGLFQVLPKYHYAYQKSGQYYNNNLDVFDKAISMGANINDLKDPLGNITIGIAMLHENYKNTNGNMQKVVGKQGEGPTAPSTYEILYYRDYLAQQDGEPSWYDDSWYIERGKR